MNAIIDFKKLAAAQESDTELVQLKSFPSSLILRDIPLPRNIRLNNICAVSADVPCPYVSPSFRRAVFDSLHALSHTGIWAMQHLVTA